MGFYHFKPNNIPWDPLKILFRVTVIRAAQSPDLEQILSYQNHSIKVYRSMTRDHIHQRDQVILIVHS